MERTHRVAGARGFADSAIFTPLGSVAVEVVATRSVAPALVAVLGCRVRRALLVAVGHAQLEQVSKAEKGKGKAAKKPGRGYMC